MADATPSNIVVTFISGSFWCSSVWSLQVSTRHLIRFSRHSPSALLFWGLAKKKECRNLRFYINLISQKIYLKKKVLINPTKKPNSSSRLCLPGIWGKYVQHYPRHTHHPFHTLRGLGLQSQTLHSRCVCRPDNGPVQGQTGHRKNDGLYANKTMQGSR